MAFDDVFILFKYFLKLINFNKTRKVTLEPQVGSFLAQSIKLRTLELQIITHNQENDKAECNRVNDRRHLISHPVCCQVLLNHLYHCLLLKEQEDSGQDNLNKPLQVKSKE